MAKYPTVLYVDLENDADWGYLACKGSELGTPVPLDGFMHMGLYRFVREVKIVNAPSVEAAPKPTRKAKKRKPR